MIMLLSIFVCFILQVTLLLLNFTQEENNNQSEERSNVLNRVNEYNRRFSGAPRPVRLYSIRLSPIPSVFIQLAIFS